MIHTQPGEADVQHVAIKQEIWKINEICSSSIVYITAISNVCSQKLNNIANK